MGKYTLDHKKYAEIARQVQAEGCVLIKNDNKALPLQKGEKLAVFGRIAFHYYKSGLGSGGLVNTAYTVGILDALKNETGITIDKDLLDIYASWIENNPFDEGEGWGKVPWSQKEMPLEEKDVIEASKKSDVGLIIIGRTAGEDQDAKDEPGSYRLSELEEEMLRLVTKYFNRTVVILNVGNIIDMRWVAKYNPSAVIYTWQGGQEGGNGIVDVLTGRVNPCGKLIDTIANEISDYPSDSNFGSRERNYYCEDIYVGYRYFETFAKESVLYPFGYGLSYTAFDHIGSVKEVTSQKVKIEVEVQNCGESAGKEVIQIYLQAPQGKLGKAERCLVGIAKTSILHPGEKETIVMEIDKYTMASYDDSGVTGHKSSYVLEEGFYNFYVGGDVRKAKKIGSIELEFSVLKKLEEAYAPVLPFERLRPVQKENGSFICGKEPVPTREVNLGKRIEENTPFELKYQGDLDYKLGDVFDGNIDLDTFVSQLSDNDMICIIRGEGMSSPKATPGVASAFGGVTDSLAKFGIPVACCADGPSGIRMDCGTKAFSIPNGTAIGCTFNMELVEELFKMVGLEVRKNKIDTILGPGINIHRHPLNGRNFEYITEDPMLNGWVASAQIRGLSFAGVTGTLKHFAANNQESARHIADSIISERALREIYLKAFEMAVTEAGAYSIMTTYGPVNGLWTAGSFDLCTQILRKEWGFDGLVMSDWGAVINDEGEMPSKSNTAAMIRAQNDIYMCVSDSIKNPEKDNLSEKLEAGYITRGHLQRSTKNILKFIMRSPIMLHYLGRISEEELQEMHSEVDQDVDIRNLVYYKMTDDTIIVNAKEMTTTKGHSELFGITINDNWGAYEVTFRMKADLGHLAQLPVSVYVNNVLKGTITILGSEGKWVEETLDLGAILGPNHYIRLYFAQTGLEIDTLTLKYNRGKSI